MTEETKEKYPSTFTIDNFSSTTTLAHNEIKVPSINQEKQYDIYEHRNVEHPNTFLGALIHILKSSLGTGILAIPRAFSNAGLIVGLVGTVLIGLLCTYTVHMLVAASHEMCRRTNTPSFGFSETAEAVFKHGPKSLRRWSTFAKNFVEIALLLTGLLGHAVYIVFISTSLNKVVNTESLSDRHYMLIIMVPLIIFCQIRELKHLVPLSFIANTTMVIAFAITLYYIFSIVPDKTADVEMATGISGIPAFFSTVIFAMEGIGSIMPVENSMIKGKFIGCPSVLNFSMTIVIVLYASIGFFGYLAYGSDTQATITNNLPAEIPAKVAQGCISTTVFFTFMLQFYVSMDITWGKLGPKIPEHRHNISQIAIRTAIVIFVTCIALAAGEHLGPLIDLVGALFFSTLGLLIPAIIDTVVNWETGFGTFKWKLVKNIFIGIVALFGLVSGSYFAIVAMVTE